MMSITTFCATRSSMIWESGGRYGNLSLTGFSMLNLNALTGMRAVLGQTECSGRNAPTRSDNPAKGRQRALYKHCYAEHQRSGSSIKEADKDQPVVRSC